MEFNELPEGHEGPQKRSTDFESPEEKLTYDADNLIALAQQISQEKGILVSPDSLITRKDDDVAALRRAIGIRLKTGPEHVENPAVADESGAVREGADIQTQPELLENLEGQYPTMKATLERYEISTKGMPTWEQIKKGLTPEVLDKALKLAEPALLLVPPTTRQSKVEAIDKHKVEGQTHDTYTYRLGDNDLWNGGKSEIENKWRVSIVEGVQDVEQDPEIYDGKRTNFEMSKAWVKKYEEQGLDVIDNADAYLTLMMTGLAEGKPVDPETYTVLNGKNLTETSLVAGGDWYDDRVGLADGDPGDSDSNLRLRGSVGVDVPQT